MKCDNKLVIDKILPEFVSVFPSQAFLCHKRKEKLNERLISSL